MMIEGYVALSRAQCGVIYRAFKEGKIEMTNTAISGLYEYNEPSYYFNGRDDIDRLKLAIECIFEQKYERAQYWLDLVFPKSAFPQRAPKPKHKFEFKEAKDVKVGDRIETFTGIFEVKEIKILKKYNFLLDNGKKRMCDSYQTVKVILD